MAPVLAEPWIEDEVVFRQLGTFSSLGMRTKFSRVDNINDKMVGKEPPAVNTCFIAFDLWDALIGPLMT
jgi:hypothetical protein